MQVIVHIRTTILPPILSLYTLSPTRLETQLLAFFAYLTQQRLPLSADMDSKPSGEDYLTRVCGQFSARVERVYNCGADYQERFSNVKAILDDFAIPTDVGMSTQIGSLQTTGPLR